VNAYGERSYTRSFLMSFQLTSRPDTFQHRAGPSSLHRYNDLGWFEPFGTLQDLTRRSARDHADPGSS
jgi:hypothetical protein